MTIADTDVLIDFLRGRGAASQVEALLKAGSLSTTAITAFELWAGAHSKMQAAAVETLLAALTLFPLDAPSAEKAARVRKELEEKRATIGMADSLIAGICLEKRASLLTRNRKHFERVSGLRLK